MSNDKIIKEIEEIKYESVAPDILLGKLQITPEVEVLGFKDNYEPAFLGVRNIRDRPCVWSGCHKIIYDNPAILKASDNSPYNNYHPNRSFNINVRRRKIPISQRAMQMFFKARAEGSKNIPDLVDFLEKELGFFPFSKIKEQEKRSISNMDWYGKPYLQYLWHIGDINTTISGDKNLSTSTFAEQARTRDLPTFNRLDNTGHIVVPTTIWAY